MKKYIPSIVAFCITYILLFCIESYAPIKLILISRFYPSLALIQIFITSLYASFVVHKLLYSKKVSVWRLRFWTFFSLVFFLQFFIGVFINSAFLQTGSPHFPIPAFILGGPVYRGGGYFMSILFVSLIFLIGPSWCSHICYIGAWDNLAAKRRVGKPIKLLDARVWILFAVVVSAFVAKQVANTTIVLALSYLFAIVSLSVILFYSRNKNGMVHCTKFCPMGLLATRIGLLNPTRVKISDTCNFCGACFKYCSYNALNMEQVKMGKPAHTCTNCGDCLNACPEKAISYKIFNFTPSFSKIIFVVLVSSIHAVTLTVARL